MWCQVILQIIEWRMDSGKPLGKLLQRHVARCPRCQQHMQARQTLADTLSRQAHEQPLPPGLADRLRATLAEHGSSIPAGQHAPTRDLRLPSKAWPVGRAALAAACLLAVVATAVILKPGHSKPIGLQPNIAGNINKAAGMIPSISPDTPVQFAQELAIAPYRQELQSLTRDVRTMVETVLEPIPPELRLAIRSTPASNRSHNP